MSALGKKILAGVLAFVVALAVLVGVLSATGVLSLDSLLLRFGIGQLADYEAPQGEGSLLEGELPGDGVPDAESRYSFTADFYPFRAMLNEAEQAAYAQVYANAMELYGQFPLHSPISPESVERVMTAVFCDQPGLFWMNTAYRYSYTGEGVVVAISLSYNDTAGEIDAARARFDAAVAQVVQAAAGYGSAVEQEKYVHDYLVETITYDLGADMNQSAYSALVNGRTVCAGYARAFQYLMQQLGLPCYFATGYAGEAHAWNVLFLEGEYYNVDVTWDDAARSGISYDYFNLTDAELNRDHTREGLSVSLPACNGTAYSYANAFGSAGAAAGGTPAAGNNPAPAPAASTPAANTPAPGAATPSARTPEDAGLARTAALSSMDAYIAACEDRVAQAGNGTHTFTLLISGEELLRAIQQQTEDGTALDAYLPGATRRLGFEAYTASVSLQSEALADGYWLLTQTVEFSGQAAQNQPAADVQPAA